MSALFEAKGTASPIRRVAAGLVVLVGVVLLISTFANNLFKVGSDFEEMIDDFRPMLEDEAIASARAGPNRSSTAFWAPSRSTGTAT